MNPITLAKHEFLLDGAAYFSDKLDLYLTIKQSISTALSIDVTDIRICGSAYWGRRFRESYAGIWVTQPDQAARFAVSFSATPSVNVTPSMTKGN